MYYEIIHKPVKEQPSVTQEKQIWQEVITQEPEGLERGTQHYLTGLAEMFSGILFHFSKNTGTIPRTPSNWLKDSSKAEVVTFISSLLHTETMVNCTYKDKCRGWVTAQIRHLLWKKNNTPHCLSRSLLLYLWLYRWNVQKSLLEKKKESASVWV